VQLCGQVNVPLPGCSGMFALFHRKLRAAASSAKRAAPVAKVAAAAAEPDPLTACQQQVAALQAQVDALNASLAGAQAALDATQIELDSMNAALVQRDADVAGEGAFECSWCRGPVCFALEQRCKAASAAY